MSHDTNDFLNQKDPGALHLGGARMDLLEMLFERMPIGIAVIDRDYKLVRANPTWAGFIEQYTASNVRQTIPGASIFDLEPGTQQVLVPLFERVFAGETVRQDAVKIESGGIASFWDIILSPLYEGERVAGTLQVSIDATGRMLAQQTLEQRVEERTRELSTLLDISHSLTSTLELQSLLDLILDQVGSVVSYDAASIMILDHDILSILAYRGPIKREDALQIRFSVHTARANREVIQGREPVIIEDILGEGHLARAVRETAGDELETTYSYLRCWMGVPLIVKDQVVGMLTLDHRQPGYYASAQADLAMAFANQAAVAIENARLHQQEQERQRELQMLLDVAAVANSSLELDETLITTLDRLVDLVAASRAGVVLIDETSGTLEAPVLRPERVIAPDDLDRILQACKRVIASGEASYIEPSPEMGFTEPGALIPLQARDRTLGVLAIIGAAGSVFSQRQLGLFKSIADQLSVAVENARLYEQAEHAAAAQERNRLARDLHDAVSQTLFSASLIADVLPRLWDRNPEVGRQKLDELRLLTRGALSEMRTLLLELRPATLVDMDLSDLLRNLANAFTGRNRIPAALIVDGQADLPPSVKEVFYRVTQEALNNITKHAEASQVSLSLQQAVDQVQLEIRDNGRGFDPQGISPDSLGLGIMRERVDGIGALLEIHTQAGAGTRIVLTWKDVKE